VKVFAAAVIGLVALIVIVMVLGTALGLHTPLGPGQHGR
jgi:hypothetical protein